MNHQIPYTTKIHRKLNVNDLPQGNAKQLYKRIEVERKKNDERKMPTRLTLQQMVKLQKMVYSHGLQSM